MSLTSLSLEKAEHFASNYAESNCWYNNNLKEAQCQVLSHQYDTVMRSNDDNVTIKCESTCNDYALPSLSSIESFISGQLESMTKPPSLQPLIQPPKIIFPSIDNKDSSSTTASVSVDADLSGSADTLAEVDKDYSIGDLNAVDVGNVPKFGYRVKLLSALDVIVSVCQPWGPKPHSTDYLYHFNQISTSNDSNLLDKYEQILGSVIKLKDRPDEKSSAPYDDLSDADFFKIIYQLHCLRHFKPYSQQEFTQILNDTVDKIERDTIDGSIETRLEDIDGEFFYYEDDNFELAASISTVEMDYVSNDKSGDEIVDVGLFKEEVEKKPKTEKACRQSYRRCYLNETEMLENRTRNSNRVDYKDMLNNSSGGYFFKRKYKTEADEVKRVPERRALKSKSTSYEEIAGGTVKKNKVFLKPHSQTYDTWWLGSSSRNLHVVSASVSYDKKQQRFMAQWKTKEGTKHSKSFYAKRYKSPTQAKHHAELYKQYILHLRNRCKGAGIPNTIPEPTFEQLLLGQIGDGFVPNIENFKCEDDLATVSTCSDEADDNITAV